MPRSQGAATGRREETERFAADVQQSLTRTPRELPSRYFYDALGSALFEAICQLPWYGITRAESRLLDTHGEDIHRRLDRLSTIIELGPGSGQKLKRLLDARRTGRQTLDVHLVDVSRSALDIAAYTLDGLDGVRIFTHAAEYGEGLDIAATVKPGGSRLVLFLGSNIGNFDRPGAAALLDGIRRSLSTGDALLLGTDLVKPEHQLQLAYDDPLGVTAAFNRNLLVRINRELEADFDIDAFDHAAVWNAPDSRMEMYLVARSTQRVSIRQAGLEFTLREGDRIWTESSYKYRPHDVATMLRLAGFTVAGRWIDERDGFLLTLATKPAAI